MIAGLQDLELLLHAGPLDDDFFCLLDSVRFLAPLLKDLLVDGGYHQLVPELVFDACVALGDATEAVVALPVSSHVDLDQGRRALEEHVVAEVHAVARERTL